VSFFRALFILALGAAVALAVEYYYRHREPEPVADVVPTIAGNLPDDPEDPPVVWLEGSIEGLDASHLSLREGTGPTIQIRRFQGGATDFLRLGTGGWRPLTAGEVDSVESGQQACVETLLDGRAFFALRVFLGARCGPA
jgi:hypothetical protein